MNDFFLGRVNVRVSKYFESGMEINAIKYLLLTIKFIIIVMVIDFVSPSTGIRSDIDFHVFAH